MNASDITQGLTVIALRAVAWDRAKQAAVHGAEAERPKATCSNAPHKQKRCNDSNHLEHEATLESERYQSFDFSFLDDACAVVANATWRLKTDEEVFFIAIEILELFFLRTSSTWHDKVEDSDFWDSFTLTACMAGIQIASKLCLAIKRILPRRTNSYLHRYLGKDKMPPLELRKMEFCILSAYNYQHVPSPLQLMRDLLAAVLFNLGLEQTHTSSQEQQWHSKSLGQTPQAIPTMEDILLKSTHATALARPDTEGNTCDPQPFETSQTQEQPRQTQQASSHPVSMHQRKKLFDLAQELLAVSYHRTSALRSRLQHLNEPQRLRQPVELSLLMRAAGSISAAFFLTEAGLFAAVTSVLARMMHISPDVLIQYTGAVVEELRS